MSRGLQGQLSHRPSTYTSQEDSNLGVTANSSLVGLDCEDQCEEEGFNSPLGCCRCPVISVSSGTLGQEPSLIFTHSALGQFLLPLTR
jgi:hypothetical protein